MKRMLIRILVYPALLYMTILAATPGCAIRSHKGIDPAFTPYVGLFEKLYNRKLNINIGFSKLEGQVVGECQRLTNSISIDPIYWNHVSFERRMALIYHEFGHCVLLRPHVEGLDAKGCPLSLMYPEVVSLECVQNNYDYYIWELFL